MTITGPVTTRLAGAPTKAFSWSFSKLKNYEVCPRRHYKIDVAKTLKDSGGAALIEGNLVHKAMAARLAEKKQLPAEYSDYEVFAKRIEEKQALLNGQLLVEQQYAIDKDFGPVEWFAKNAWFRGIGDVVLLAPPVALILDWKTGKITEESAQLMLMAQCIFSHYPDVMKVASRFAWLKEHAETDDVFDRNDMVRLWPGVLARVGFMERSAASMDYPPKPGGMCRKYCPDTSCPFHGKGG